RALVRAGAAAGRLRRDERPMPRRGEGAQEPGDRRLRGDRGLDGGSRCRARREVRGNAEAAAGEGAALEAGAKVGDGALDRRREGLPQSQVRRDRRRERAASSVRRAGLEARRGEYGECLAVEEQVPDLATAPVAVLDENTPGAEVRQDSR